MGRTKSIVNENFAKPKGFMGNLIGDYMAVEYFDINMWVVKNLDIHDDDNILEIGFGPGVAIEAMSCLAPRGHITGIDYSETMLAQAKKRNLRAIQSGQVDLRLGNISDLPDFDRQFDRVVSVNNIMYWTNPIETLRHLKQYVAPGGFVALVFQRNEELYLSGQCNGEINCYMHYLLNAGFQNVRFVPAPVEINNFSNAENRLTKKMQKRHRVTQERLAGIAIIGDAPTLFDEMAFPNYEINLDDLGAAKTMAIQKIYPKSASRK